MAVGGEQPRSGGQETFLVFITQGLTLAGTVAVQSALARMLGANGRGEYAVLVLFATAFPVVFTAGVDRASQYFAMAGRLPIWGAIFAAATILAAGSLLAALIAVPLINSDIAFFNQAPKHLLYVSLALFPLTGLLTLAQLHVAGRRQFRAMAVASLLQTISNLVCLGIFMVAFEDDILAALLAYAASLLASSGMLFHHLARVEPLSFEFGLRGIAPIARYGARYYVARIGNLVDLAMGTLLLAFVADSGAIGIYAAVSAIALKVLLGAESIEGALLPRVAADPGTGVHLAMTSFRVSLVLTFAGVALLCMTAPLLVRLLFSDDFASGAPLIWTMAPGLAVQGGAAMLMAFYRATNRPDLCSMAVWIGMCVNAAGFFALYPTTGLYAAGISMALGLLARGSFLMLTFARQNDARVADLLIPRRADWDLIRRSLGQILPRFDAARTRA